MTDRKNVMFLTPKAKAIREGLTDAPMTIEPPREDTYDADKNKQLFEELNRLQRRAQIENYMIMWGEMPVATVVFHSTEKQCKTIVTTFVNGCRVMWKSVVRGSGFDRRTAALSGLLLPGVHSYYEECSSPKNFKLVNEGERWDTLLLKNGFKVWRTL
jgi:hypothetical protein